MSEVTYAGMQKRIEALKSALAQAADALHFGGQKARSPSFATQLFAAEQAARAALGEKE